MNYSLDYHLHCHLHLHYIHLLHHTYVHPWISVKTSASHLLPSVFECDPPVSELHFRLTLGGWPLNHWCWPLNHWSFTSMTLTTYPLHLCTSPASTFTYSKIHVSLVNVDLEWTTILVVIHHPISQLLWYSSITHHFLGSPTFTSKIFVKVISTVCCPQSPSSTRDSLEVCWSNH